MLAAHPAEIWVRLACSVKIENLPAVCHSSQLMQLSFFSMEMEGCREGMGPGESRVVSWVLWVEYIT